MLGVTLLFIYIMQNYSQIYHKRKSLGNFNNFEFKEDISVYFQKTKTLEIYLDNIPKFRMKWDTTQKVTFVEKKRYIFNFI